VFTIIFTQAARAELIDAQDWYEREAAGLGRHFREAIDALTERMSTNSQQFPIAFKSVRRALLRRFPYALFFAVTGDTLSVIACFHASRDPLQWQKRT
jgi:plasmid stabilization system protein ParE